MNRSRGDIRHIANVVALAAAFAAGTGTGHAGTLFDPTPQDAVRPLSTDRPDVTESPYTVDGGHVQVEADLLWFSRDEGSGVEFEELRLGQMNVKLGLHDRADLQFIVAPYVKTTVRFGSFGLIEETGASDIILRLKLNVTGNDGHGPAVALLPFVSLPTGSGPFEGGETAFGLAIPAAFALPGVFGLGVMGQMNEAPGGGSYLGTVSVSCTVQERAGLFLEFAAERSEPDAGSGFWRPTLNTGATYAITPDVQLDGAGLFGLNDNVPDWTAYLGLTVRR